MMIKRSKVHSNSDKAFKDKDSNRIFMSSKNRKRQLTIILISCFLVIFISILIFEFRHLLIQNSLVVQPATPTVTLESKEKKNNFFQIFKNKEKIESKVSEEYINKEEKSSLSLGKIKQLVTDFFSKVDKKITKRIDSETEEETKTGEESKQLVELSKEEIKVEEESKQLVIEPSKEDSKQLKKSKNEQQKIFTKEYKYTIQLLSVEERYYSKALQFTKELFEDGYYAYIYKTPKKIINSNYKEGMYFYRIRIGFFKTKREATITGKEVAKRYENVSNNFFITTPLAGEYNGEIVIYGPQKL